MFSAILLLSLKSLSLSMAERQILQVLKKKIAKSALFSENQPPHAPKNAGSSLLKKRQLL
jgi:hypothetical protein